jgi:hypothetical protein
MQEGFRLFLCCQRLSEGLVQFLGYKGLGEVGVDPRVQVQLVGYDPWRRSIGLPLGKLNGILIFPLVRLNHHFGRIRSLSLALCENPDQEL